MSTRPWRISATEEPQPRSRTGLIVGIIIGVIVLIIIIIIVIILLTRGNGDNGNGAVDCTSNADCPSPLVCNTTTGACVICVQDDDCTNPATPKCDPNTNLCLQCLENSDCDEMAGEICQNTMCVAPQ